MKDSERAQTPPRGATTSGTFDRYMSRVDARCTHLTTLLDLRDLDSVVDVASSAVKLWLQGRDASRELVERDETNAPAARQHLDALYARLLEAMQRADTMLAGHPTRDKLDDLRTQLVKAAEALNRAAATPAKALTPTKAAEALDRAAATPAKAPPPR